MKAIVIFDSKFGNTKLIANTIAKKLGTNVPHIYVGDLKASDIDEYDLLIIGSPVVGWRPTERIIEFLYSLDPGKLKNKNVAVFDTKIKLLISSNCAKKISYAFKKAGAYIIVPPIEFYIKKKQTVLLDGELERAEDWATSIKTKLEPIKTRSNPIEHSLLNSKNDKLPFFETMR